MFIQSGQHSIISKKFPAYNKEKSYIIAEAGNDTGNTFKGAFVVHVHYKGNYRFENGKGQTNLNNMFKKI